MARSTLYIHSVFSLYRVQLDQEVRQVRKGKVGTTEMKEQ